MVGLDSCTIVVVSCCFIIEMFYFLNDLNDELKQWDRKVRLISFQMNQHASHHFQFSSTFSLLRNPNTPAATSAPKMTRRQAKNCHARETQHLGYFYFIFHVLLKILVVSSFYYFLKLKCFKQNNSTSISMIAMYLMNYVMFCGINWFVAI